MSATLALDLETPVRDGITTFTTFVPKLLGFLVILLVGYFVAKIIAKLVDKGLEKAGFDRAVERGGIKKALAKSSYDASDIVAKLVFFAIFIPFLSAAVGTLGISALEQPLSAFIALIPRIIVAIVLVVIGAVIAGTVKSFIQNALGGLSYGKVLANVASILILLGFVKSALDQVGIATTVTGPLLYTILGTVAGVIIIGAGGGLIKPMQSRWETMLNKAETESANVKAQAQTSRSTAHHADRRRLPGRALLPERPDRSHRRAEHSTTPRPRRTAPARAASRTRSHRSPVPSRGRAPARRAGCPRRESNSRRPP